MEAETKEKDPRISQTSFRESEGQMETLEKETGKEPIKALCPQFCASIEVESD